MDSKKWIKKNISNDRKLFSKKVHLLLIDCQKDFCFLQGSLFVQGATEDCVRSAKFIYQNVYNLHNIFLTLDTHPFYHIANPAFWLKKDNELVPPFTTITNRDLSTKKLFPNPEVMQYLSQFVKYEDLCEYVRLYCNLWEQLDFDFCVWPFHCLEGTQGQILVGGIEEACFFHFSVTKKTPSFLQKGNKSILEENYSPFSSVSISDPKFSILADRNFFPAEKLLECDMLLVAGQALDFCVYSTVYDLTKKSNMSTQIFVLSDCTSSIHVENQKDIQKKLEKRNVSFVTSEEITKLLSV